MVETRFFPTRKQAWYAGFHGVMPELWWDGFSSRAELNAAISDRLGGSFGSWTSGSLPWGYSKQMLLIVGAIDREGHESVTESQCRAAIAEYERYNDCNLEAMQRLIVHFRLPLDKVSRISREEQSWIVRALYCAGGFPEKVVVMERLMSVKSWACYRNVEVGELLPDQRTKGEEIRLGCVDNVVLFHGSSPHAAKMVDYNQLFDDSLQRLRERRSRPCFYESFAYFYGHRGYGEQYGEEEMGDDEEQEDVIKQEVDDHDVEPNVTNGRTKHAAKPVSGVFEVVVGANGSIGFQPCGVPGPGAKRSVFEVKVAADGSLSFQPFADRCSRARVKQEVIEAKVKTEVDGDGNFANGAVKREADDDGGEDHRRRSTWDQQQQHLGVTTPPLKKPKRREILSMFKGTRLLAPSFPKSR